MVLVEVHRDNLASVLELVANSRTKNRLAALLDANLDSPHSQLVADALLEAGAIAVLDSPRQIATLLDVASCTRRTAPHAESRHGESDSLMSVIDEAWAALPWQDS